MPYAKYEQDRDYLTNKFRNPVFEPGCGEDNKTVKAGILPCAEIYKDLPKPVIKAKCFEYICRHMQIDVNPHDDFPAFGCYNRNDRPISPILWKWFGEIDKEYLQDIIPELDARNNAGLHRCWKDFDHSVPDWHAILTLGFPGLLQRAKDCRSKQEKAGTLTPEKAGYYDGVILTMQAVLDCIQRFIDFAKEKHGDNPRIQREIRVLEQMKTGAPRDFYEVLMIIYLHFMFCEHVDHMQVRSLGNLDDTLLPYYERDLKEGRYTMEDIHEFMACFLMQWGSINNYWGHPFYLGGTKADGSAKYNEVSWLILNTFDKLDITTPKIQLKVSKNTPDKLYRIAIDMIRRGHNSLVFVGEESIWRAMMAAGCTETDARECDIKGCYEFAPKGSANSTGCGHLNFLKPIELIFNDGTDLKTGYHCNCNAAKLKDIHSFDDFYEAYLLYVKEEAEGILRVSRAFEKYLNQINPSSMFSISIKESIENGNDAFFNGCKRNSSTILLTGIGTAVDALMAVKEQVFEKKNLTLEQFRDILNSNWDGQEKLRLKMLRSKLKYGNGIKEVDKYAHAITHFTASLINFQPNSRGGYYFASGHCAKQYFEMGLLTAATPDGRKAGDEMSKNLSPTMGMDVNGVTALIKSVNVMDSADMPGDFPLDVMMHPSSVQGEEGYQAMKALIRTYMEGHGIAIHFNIFDSSVLEDAQKHPENYSGLQIRVCGWNVHFTEMCKKEQDAYIERAKMISE